MANLADDNAQIQQETPPSLIPSKADFYKELRELLKDNAKWVEQVKMSLLIISHLYESFLKIEGSYDLSLKECKKAAEFVKEKYEQIKQIEQEINAHYELLKEKAAEFEERIQAQAEKVEGIREDCEYLKHEIDVYYTEIENFRVKLELFKGEFDEKQKALLKTIADFNAEFAEKKGALERLIADANADLNALRTQANLDKEALKTTAQEAQQNINNTKDAAKAEIETLRSDILDEMRDKAQEQKENLESFAENHLGTLYAHIFSIERVLLDKGVVSLGEMMPLREQGEQP